MDPSIPPRAQPIPPASYARLAYEAPVDAALIALFAQAHRGPRAPGSGGRTAQEADCAQKLTSFTADYTRLTGERFTIDALAGPRVDWVLGQRRDPATGRPVRAATRNAYRRVLSSFATWLGPQVGVPLAFGGRREREDRDAEPVTFSEHQLTQVLRHLRARDTVTSRRLTAAIFLALDAGPRAGELSRLLLSGLDRARTRATIDRKGVKERSIPISAATWRELDRYLAVRRSSLAHLFVVDDGTAALAPGALGLQLRRVLDRLGLRVSLSRADLERQPDLINVPRQGKGLSIQALRRTFIRLYRRGGRSWQEMEAIMGWTPEYAAQVARHYDRVTADDLSAVHDPRSPIERFCGPRAG